MRTLPTTHIAPILRSHCAHIAPILRRSNFPRVRLCIPDRGSGLGLRRAFGAFSTEHERQRRVPHGKPVASPEGAIASPAPGNGRRIRRWGRNSQHGVCVAEHPDRGCGLLRRPAPWGKRGKRSKRRGVLGASHFELQASHHRLSSGAYGRPTYGKYHVFSTSVLSV